MPNILYIMTGGALGALMRYGVAQLGSRLVPTAPWAGTFAANLLGCLLLGLLTGLGLRHPAIPRGVLLMLTTGMCGAFTTFSTFSSETVRMMEQGHTLQAFLYVAVSILLGLALFYLGKQIA